MIKLFIISLITGLAGYAFGNHYSTYQAMDRCSTEIFQYSAKNSTKYMEDMQNYYGEKVVSFDKAVDFMHLQVYYCIARKRFEK